jgi:hypothetical protein
MLPYSTVGSYLPRVFWGCRMTPMRMLLGASYAPDQGRPTGAHELITNTATGRDGRRWEWAEGPETAMAPSPVGRCVCGTPEARRRVCAGGTYECDPIVRAPRPRNSCWLAPNPRAALALGVTNYTPHPREVPQLLVFRLLVPLLDQKVWWLPFPLPPRGPTAGQHVVYHRRSHPDRGQDETCWQGPQEGPQGLFVVPCEKGEV